MNKLTFLINKRYNITFVLSIIYVVLFFFPALVYINTSNPTENAYCSYFQMITHGFCIIKILLMIVCNVSIFIFSKKIVKGITENKSNVIIICSFILHFLLNRWVWKDWEALFYPTGDIFFTYIFYWIVDVLIVILLIVGFFVKNENNVES